MISSWSLVPQSSVATDETNLAKALSAQGPSSSGSTGSPGTPSSATTSAPSASGGSSSSEKTGAAGTGGSASTDSDSAEQIASDESSVDSAQANLTEAQQALDDAQLSSPVSGTVASVGVSVGATVSAGSSTSAIVIIGTQSYEVTETLSSTQVASVKDGDSAQVTVDGETTAFAGTVAQVGPVQSSSSGYTYPTVIALPATAQGLHSGSTASVSITTGEARNVLAVPTSAVTTQGTKSYVLVLSSGSTKQKQIKVGIVGDIYTQVISGLRERQRGGAGRLLRGSAVVEYDDGWWSRCRGRVRPRCRFHGWHTQRRGRAQRVTTSERTAVLLKEDEPLGSWTLWAGSLHVVVSGSMW